MAEVGVEVRTYTVEEAAKILGIGRSLAYRLAARGDIPALRLGSRLVITKKGLETFLEGKGTGEEAK